MKYPKIILLFLSIASISLWTSCKEDTEELMVNLTFQVQANIEDVSGGMFVVNSFDNFEEALPMTEIEAGLYRVTTVIPKNQTYLYRFVKGTEEEIVPEECGLDDGSGVLARRIVIKEEDSFIIDPVCFSSCKTCMKIELSVTGEMNDKAIAFGQEHYSNSQGQYLRFTDFQFYLSEIELLADDGTATLLSEVILHDFKNPNNLVLNKSIVAADYKQIRYNIGLTPSQNNSDPANYEAIHPLSTTQQMHWGWASKYKFIKVEGKVDTEDGEILENSFAYHTGFEELTRTVTQDLDLMLQNDGMIELEMKIDLDQIFDDLDMIENNTSHTLTPTATKIHDNFAQAIEVVIN